MRRSKGPWFRKSTRRWYITIQGKQINLGPDKKEAFMAFHKIMGHPPGELAAPIACANPTNVGDVITAFLDFVKANRTEGTYKAHIRYLKPFAQTIGAATLVESLKTYHLVNWINERWKTDDTRRCAIISVKAAFNYAVTIELIPHNPFGKVRRPKGRSRKAFLSEKDQVKLLDIWDDGFHDFILVAIETGARPGELRMVEARHVQGNRIVLQPSEHKTGLTTREDRVIYLTAKAKQVIDALVAKYPSGPLFRNSKGNPWHTVAIVKRFRNARRQGKLPKGVTAYALRHTFATQALKSGVHPEELRVLLGHTTMNMIAKHYSHLSADAEHMSNAVERARAAFK